MTPDQVHYGQADAVHAARQITLDEAFRANPERFGNCPGVVAASGLGVTETAELLATGRPLEPRVGAKFRASSAVSVGGLMRFPLIRATDFGWGVLRSLAARYLVAGFCV